MKKWIPYLHFKVLSSAYLSFSVQLNTGCFREVPILCLLASGVQIVWDDYVGWCLFHLLLAPQAFLPESLPLQLPSLLHLWQPFISFALIPDRICFTDFEFYFSYYVILLTLCEVNINCSFAYIFIACLYMFTSTFCTLHIYTGHPLGVSLSLHPWP